MRRILLCLGIVGLLSACGTIHYIDIETYNPAEVTFPENVGKVLVVNNAVPQPEDTGYEYILQGQRQDTCSAKADSALFDACRTLGLAMVEASYFNDVLLYHDAVRTDRQANLDVRLTPERVALLCEEAGADAVISIDRLLFDMKKKVDAMGVGFLLGTIDVRMEGVIRSYLPGRETPLATVYMQDSLFWSESTDYLPILDQLLPTPENALRTAGAYFGAKAYPNFVPHWQKETRWYFIGTGSRWKEASAYVATERWDLAQEQWVSLYHRTRSGKSRAKIASNLALCHELKGELKEAFDWAQKSYESFKRHSGEHDKMTQLLELYVKTLAERIRSDQKLDIQISGD